MRGNGRRIRLMVQGFLCLQMGPFTRVNGSITSKVVRVFRSGAKTSVIRVNGVMARSMGLVS